MNNVLNTANEYRDRTRVEVENLLPWAVGFQAYTLAERKGIVVEGGHFKEDGSYKKSVYRQLTLEEIIEQISSENIAFIGTDGKGAHACFKICDFELYKVAFDLPDATEFPIQLTQEAVENLLKINDQKKFKKELEELVVTPSEKRAFAHFLVNNKRVNELPLSILKYIENYTSMKIVNE